MASLTLAPEGRSIASGFYGVTVGCPSAKLLPTSSNSNQGTMKLQEILSLYDREQRLEAEEPGMRREANATVVRQVGLHGRQSWILYSNLSAANIDGAIDEQIAYFSSLGHSFEWKVFSHDPMPDLKERLTARGFELEETEAILVLDLETLPVGLAEPVRHDVRRITDPVRLEDVSIVKHAVWGEDTTGSAERLARELREQPDRLRVFVAYENGIPASAGWLACDPGKQFASLWGGSTIAAFRKRGLYTALVAIRAQEARRSGARFLTVDARPMSRPILERLGFQVMTFANALNWRVRG